MFSNLTQLVGVPLNGVIINLGSSAVVEWTSFSSSSHLCVTSNSASIFSCHIRRLCTKSSSCHKHNSVKQRSSSCCCSCFTSNCFLSIFLSISSCLLFKNCASFSFSTRNMVHTWPSRPSAIVSLIEQIHHDLFSFPLLVK